MTKTLVLIRHAHRDTTVRALDNGLSEKGREQARQLKLFFSERFDQEDLKKGLWIVSSPKVRCVETLQPIAKALGRSVDVHPGLAEQGSKESPIAFEARLRDFLKEWQTSAVPLALACGHGDGMPLAVQNLVGLRLEMKKGAWVEVESQQDTAASKLAAFALRWYIPSFKHIYR